MIVFVLLSSSFLPSSQANAFSIRGYDIVCLLSTDFTAEISVIPIHRPILDGLGDMGRGKPVLSGKVRF